MSCSVYFISNMISLYKDIFPLSRAARLALSIGVRERRSRGFTCLLITFERRQKSEKQIRFSRVRFISPSIWMSASRSSSIKLASDEASSTCDVSKISALLYSVIVSSSLDSVSLSDDSEITRFSFLFSSR